MQQHHQTHLPSSPPASLKPLSSPKPLFLFPIQTRAPKLRFGVSATARFVSKPKSTMYDLLSVKESAGFEEIKAAYRKVARRWHPDTCRSENKDFCTQQFIKAREAYRVLSDPVLRKDYDHVLQNGIDVDGNILACGFGDWESQLEGLKSRSNGGNSSWASRMRAKHNQV